MAGIGIFIVIVGGILTMIGADPQLPFAKTPTLSAIGGTVLVSGLAILAGA